MYSVATKELFFLFFSFFWLHIAFINQCDTSVFVQLPSRSRSPQQQQGDHSGMWWGSRAHGILGGPREERQKSVWLHAARWVKQKMSNLTRLTAPKTFLPSETLLFFCSSKFLFNIYYYLGSTNDQMVFYGTEYKSNFKVFCPPSVTNTSAVYLTLTQLFCRGCGWCNNFLSWCFDPQTLAGLTSRLVCTSWAAAPGSSQLWSFSIRPENPGTSTLCLSCRRTCMQLPNQVHPADVSVATLFYGCIISLTFTGKNYKFGTNNKENGDGVQHF